MIHGFRFCGKAVSLPGIWLSNSSAAYISCFLQIVFWFLSRLPKGYPGHRARAHTAGGNLGSYVGRTTPFHHAG